MSDKERQKATNQKKWVVKIEHLDEADRYNNDLCVKLPDELMKQLGWEIGDEIEWEFMDAALNDVLEEKDDVICDVCGRVVDEYETILTSTLAGVVMCAGKMKDNCKSHM